MLSEMLLQVYIIVTQLQDSLDINLLMLGFVTNIQSVSFIIHICPTVGLLQSKNRKITPSCDSYLNAIHYEH